MKKRHIMNDMVYDFTPLEPADMNQKIDEKKLSEDMAKNQAIIRRIEKLEKTKYNFN